MQMKSIIFGFGLGMVFLSVVFFVSFRFEAGGLAVSDEAIEARAIEMGMIWPTEDIPEIVRKALEMGMVFSREDE